jgi:hypothetical protein
MSFHPEVLTERLFPWTPDRWLFRPSESWKREVLPDPARGLWDSEKTSR